jgi:hypothetical protein
VSPIFRACLLGILAAGLVAVTGCGGTTGSGASGVDVKGRIVKSKEPLKGNVTVRLVSTDGSGSPAGGQADKEGNVTISGKVRPGTYKMCVYNPDQSKMLQKGAGGKDSDPAGKMSEMMGKGQGMQGGDPMELMMLANDTLQGKFSAQNTTITVKVGTTDPFDFGEIDLDDETTHKR